MAGIEWLDWQKQFNLSVLLIWHNYCRFIGPFYCCCCRDNVRRVLFFSIPCLSSAISKGRCARDRTNYFCSGLLSLFKYLPHNGPTFCSTFYRYADDMGQGRNINRGQEAKSGDAAQREKWQSSVCFAVHQGKWLLTRHRTGWWGWWWFRLLGDNYCAHYHNFTKWPRPRNYFWLQEAKTRTRVWHLFSCCLKVVLCKRLRSNGCCAGKGYCESQV